MYGFAKKKENNEIILSVKLEERHESFNTPAFAKTQRSACVKSAQHQGLARWSPLVRESVRRGLCMYPGCTNFPHPSVPGHPVDILHEN